MLLLTYLPTLPLLVLATAIPTQDEPSRPQTPGFCAFPNTADVNTVVTKDCCAATRHKAYYSSPVLRCMPNGGPAGHLNEQGFTECCNSRGTHSVFKP